MLQSTRPEINQSNRPNIKAWVFVTSGVMLSVTLVALSGRYSRSDVRIHRLHAFWDLYFQLPCNVGLDF